MKQKRIKVWVAALLLGPGCSWLPARGHFLPRGFIDSNNGNVGELVAPTADFSAELARLNLPPSKYLAVTNGATLTSQTVEAELLDLTEALKKAGAPQKEIERITAGQRAEREKLKAYLDELHALQATVPITNFPIILSVQGLPNEFADYFEGAIAWQNPAHTNSNDARTAWRDVLNLPAPERHFKSTWAAFMLGKSFQKDDPTRAITYFQRVRDLVDHRFADSVGLAAASLGLEAQTDLQQGKIASAIELYLQQLQTGDPSAFQSLRLTASAAVNKLDATSLAALATNSHARDVITAYLVSRNYHGQLPEESSAAKKWLAAVETVDAHDIASTEKFALAAYQIGDWEVAQRWINRAPTQPANQWLQAKLLLRDGQIDQAAAALAKVVPLFSLQSPLTNAPPRFEDGLSVPSFNQNSLAHDAQIPASLETLGEMGVLHLVRREYVEALDALLRSGFDIDAAYVAERVLTVNELKDYVDHNWPVATNAEIRDLLAQRLARLGRAAEARPYYLETTLPAADALAQALAQSTNATLPPLDRARALFAAAQITETNGRFLLGENLDQSIYFDTNVIGGPVFGRTNATLLRASDDELSRVAQSAPEPNHRYFYRFQAADLAWQAALLLPDNSDETARVLCEAGTWIKYLDPKKADVFYKALVRRCHGTALGAAADRKRWFPLLDEEGNMLPEQ